MKKQYSKFLRILITSILYIGYFSISSSLAQISEGGLPPSFQFAGSLRSEKLAEQVPVNFSVEDLKTVDAWRVSQGAPLRVAKSIPTSFDIADSGDWISLPDGSQVWQLHLQAKGAIALILYYSDFYIPKGARLYLYNAAKTQVLGAYTHRTHPENGPFATQAVAGDEVILEYVPAPSGETPRLRIREVGCCRAISLLHGCCRSSLLRLILIAARSISWSFSVSIQTPTIRFTPFGLLIPSRPRLRAIPSTPRLMLPSGTSMDWSGTNDSSPGRWTARW